MTHIEKQNALLNDLMKEWEQETAATWKARLWQKIQELNASMGDE